MYRFDFVQRRRHAFVVILALAGCDATQPVEGGPDAGTGDVGGFGVVSSPLLPFDMPANGVLRGTARKVFAHYFPPFPISIDDQNPATDYYQRNFLTTGGEGGKHAAYGGFLRDRPLPRAPIGAGYKLVDLENEVRQAIAGGIDGFAVDIMQYPSSTNLNQVTTTRTLMKAAEAVDPAFKIMIMLDMSAGGATKSQAEVAAYVAELAASPAAYRLADGRLVLSAFKAEGHDATWWKSFFSLMKTQHGTTVAFLPTFLNEQLWASTFAPFSYGMGNWGSRNPAYNDPTTTTSTSPLGRVAKVHALGVKWMQPVSIQDERPNQGIYDEAQNTQNLRNTWQIARDSNAELVQIPTWNDYSEGAQLAPSARHGFGFLDISAYYLVWYKLGAPPTIVRDSVYLTHRTQPYAAPPSYPQKLLMKLRGGSPARDTVEALSFLTAPGIITITVGGHTTSCSAAAGVSSCLAPLSAGSISVAVTRGGATVASLTSPNQVTATPYVQDLQYVAASSGRQGTSTGVASIVKLTPIADAYANEGAAATSYGTSWSLASRGSLGYVSYLRFAIPATPSGKTLVGASLAIHTTPIAGAGSTVAHSVKLASNTWSEAMLTWNNRPSVSATELGNLASVAGDTGAAIVLEPSGLRSLGGSSISLAVTSVGTDSLWFWSREQTDVALQPQLTLSYQ